MSSEIKKNFDSIKEGTMFRSNENVMFIIKSIYTDPTKQYLEVIPDITGVKAYETYICELYCIENNKTMFSPIQYDHEDDKIYFVLTGENDRIIVRNIEEFMF